MRPRYLALLIIAHPLWARAQAANAANLLSKMEDLAIYPIIPLSRSDRNYALTGYGFEFSFKIGEKRRPITAAEREDRCARLNAQKPNSCDPAKIEIFTLTPIQIRPTRNGPDTTFSVDVKKLDIRQVLFEASVGSQFTDLRSDAVLSGWQLNGRVQEFPILSVYATFRDDWPLSPYVGMSFVQADLKNVKLTAADSAATVESSALGGAATLGVVREILGFDAFAELNRKVLRFNTRGWKQPGNMPAGTRLPDFLELSGLNLRLGVQLSLGGKK